MAYQSTPMRLPELESVRRLREGGPGSGPHKSEIAQTTHQHDVATTHHERQATREYRKAEKLRGEHNKAKALSHERALNAHVKASDMHKKAALHGGLDDEDKANKLSKIANSLSEKLK